ncbi:phage gp6-like head-tail connector protein [Sinorhizobium meliloti WSM1022]|uniref:head-tail connector protein n=1 Tax=Rhizobium meliloti TaxID=382 RepID=UPI0004240F3B|nr:head-tail connector protein [Sinorhizobium meliloti]MDW9841140.1 phage gp6-like head-tail connector protein [Sinorhizobium meliloti]QKN13575.1 phage gp6-like head-tail connector protein [Sinorhizobium meliloti WSM1022]
MSIVTLSLLKSQLNIDHDVDDALLQHKIAAAEDWTSAYLGRSLAGFDFVPAGVVEAVLQLASHLYENREAVLVGVNAYELPYGVIELLRPHRIEVTGHVAE